MVDQVRGAAERVGRARRCVSIHAGVCIALAVGACADGDVQGAALENREPVALVALEPERLSRAGEPTAVPDAVLTAFAAADAREIAVLERAFAADGGAGIERDPSVTRVDVPRGPAASVRLYTAVEACCAVSSRHHLLLLFDPVTGTAGPEPLRVETRFQRSQPDPVIHPGCWNRRRRALIRRRRSRRWRASARRRAAPDR